MSALVKFKRDRGLMFRMYFTMFLFTGLYVGFGVLLWSLGTSLTYLIPIMATIFLIQLLFSDSIVLGASGARVVSEKDAPELHSIVGDLARRAGLPKPRIAIINSAMPNAFATGLTRKKALVAVTKGLMQQLSREELTGVLAHELGHIQNRDMRVISIANFFVALTSFLLTILFFRAIFGGGDRNGAAPILLLYLATMIVYFLGSLLVMSLSRHREYLADHAGAEISGDPNALASALEKIHIATHKIPREQLSKLQTASALCVMPAYTKNDVASLFSTHPPIQERIKRLRALEKAKVGSSANDYRYRWDGAKR